MKAVLLVFFVIQSIAAQSQQTGAYYMPRSEDLPRERLSLSISPLALVDTYSGSAYKAGITFCPSIFRISADAGGYLPNLSQKISFWNDLKGYHFRTSVGLYPGRLNQWHFGFEYQYKKQSFNYDDSIPNMPEFNAEVRKFVHVGNIYMGYNAEITRSLYLEVRGGIGVRYRDIFNTRSDDVSNSVYWYDSMNQGRITNKQSLMPNLSLSVRLNYILWRKK
jgi:hypothetical protein